MTSMELILISAAYMAIAVAFYFTIMSFYEPGGVVPLSTARARAATMSAIWPAAAVSLFAAALYPPLGNWILYGKLR